MLKRRKHALVYYRFAYVLVYGLMRRGMSEEEACRKLNFIPVADTSKLYRIPIEHFLRACSIVKNSSQDPFYCMQLGQSIQLADFGPLARTLSLFNDSREAVNFYNKMQWLLSEPAVPKLFFSDDFLIARLNKVPKEYDYTPVIELNTGIMLGLYNQVTGGFGKQYIKKIHFTHSLPTGLTAQQYQQVLGCPVLFNQEYNALFLDKKAAELKLHTADQDLLQQSQQQFLQLNEALNNQQSLTAKIIGQIHELKDYQISIDQVADLYAISVSTLKRRLQQENTQFQQLLDQAKLEQAVQLLDHSKLEISEIAYQLGYQSPASFSRAFKRMLGISARDYRSNKSL